MVFAAYRVIWVVKRVPVNQPSHLEVKKEETLQAFYLLTWSFCICLEFVNKDDHGQVLDCIQKSQACIDDQPSYYRGVTITAINYLVCDISFTQSKSYPHSEDHQFWYNFSIALPLNLSLLFFWVCCLRHSWAACALIARSLTVIYRRRQADGR